MLSHRYFRLRTLGQLTLVSVAGDREAAAPVRPRHLAVLTVLAIARRTVMRDSLLEMFWGGETEVRARHSLSNALSGLRALLGATSITARHDQVALEAAGQLEVDAVQFTSACELHDDERAFGLYAGPFLHGVHVPDAPEFDAWVARERNRLERLFLEGCERRLPALLRARDWPRASSVAERWLEWAPRSSAPFLALLRAHAGPGTPVALSAALATYDRVRLTLDDTYGVTPDPAVARLASELQEQLAESERETSTRGASIATVASPRTSSHSPSATAPPAAVPQIALEVPNQPTPPRAVRMSWIGWSAIGVAAAAVFTAVVLAQRRSTTPLAPDRPIVAVTAIDDVRGDSAVAWLRAGLPRMIAADLGAIGGIEVVAPTRVRDVLVRLTGATLPRITEDQSLDVARRLGASWVVTGGVSAGNKGYLLDITLRNIASPGETRNFTILASNPIDLGKMTASRLASLLNVSLSGSAPRFSGIETASPEAYRHFIRGVLAVESEQLVLAGQELDAAIGLDSGFVIAVRYRLDIAARLGDDNTRRRLARLEARFTDRLPEFDRSSDEIRNLDSLGEHERASALAERLLTRFPHDPRAYNLRASMLSSAGQWGAAEAVLVRELGLDSLAISAGDGPCTPCEVLWQLAEARLLKGDRIGAEQAARRWVALQPELPGAWRSLSATLAAVGASSEAVNAGAHFITLSNEPPALVEFARTMISARRPDIADSLVRSWRGTTDPVLADGARDIESILLRERGDFAGSAAVLTNLEPMDGLQLIRADNLARSGRLAEARAIYERTGHQHRPERRAQFTPPEARGYAWSHTLEADALARAGDTSAARALIDSIASVGRQSYYSRDWRLHHHVRGMLFFAEHKFADAEREFRAAEWSAGGWTRTNVELARTQLAEHRPLDAIATLRDAFTAPLDAMGRYVPRSELDAWMSRAFADAGQRDSAAVYLGYATASRRIAAVALH